MPSTGPASDYPTSALVTRLLDDAGVLLITFNRPERNNAWTLELEEAYFGSLITAANDPAVRAIVVTGAGKSFCPGLDMEILSDSAAGRPSQLTVRRWPMTTARLIPKPIIAAVNGAAAGIGFIQMASCDLRFASSSARLTTSFARRGLPAENSLSWILPRLVGTGAAMDLLLSARVIDATEALALGLVNRVCEPERLVDEAVAYARDLSQFCSPHAMASIKGQINADWERGAEEARLRSLVLMSEHGSSADFAEGVNSYTQRRPPAFAGLDARLQIHRSINR